MNFKRNFLTISALVGTVLLAGCTLRNVFAEYQYSELVIDSHEEETKCDGALVKKGDYDPYYAMDDDKLVNVGSFYNVMTKRTKLTVLPSDGEQKILVVPVEFKEEGTVESYLRINKEEYIENIQKAFFGNTKNNSYVSVAQFYDVSSYGKLKITGKVCDRVCQIDERISDLLKKSGSVDARNFVSNLYAGVIEWYNKWYDDIDTFRQDTDDSNNVPIYLIYDYPAIESESLDNVFWNYTFRDKNLCWTSYFSLNEHNGKVDAHTLIHEVGHLLGLVDYYPSPSNGKTANDIEPVKCIDMMDCSLGDHTALSKMLLNWTRPYHVTNSCEITLKSFTETGDLLLFNDNWNGTVFDEFYLLEFYTPTGLNTFDVAYGNNRAKLPKLPGIKLYHVDTNLGYFVEEKARTGIYTLDRGAHEEGFKLSSGKLDFIHDNNDNKIDGKNGKTYINYLYELVSKYAGSSSPIITDYYLYHAGDTINEFRFSGNHQADYTIDITSINKNGATLKITKN